VIDGRVKSGIVCSVGQEDLRVVEVGDSKAGRRAGLPILMANVPIDKLTEHTNRISPPNTS